MAELTPRNCLMADGSVRPCPVKCLNDERDAARAEVERVRALLTEALDEWTSAYQCDTMREGDRLTEFEQRARAALVAETTPDPRDAEIRRLRKALRGLLAVTVDVAGFSGDMPAEISTTTGAMRRARAALMGEEDAPHG